MSPETLTGIWVGLGTGAATSAVVSFLFYRLGRKDGLRSERNAILSYVSMPIREMTPTSRNRVPHGYGLIDTAHWMTCISELLEEAGFVKESKVMKSIARDMESSIHYEKPTKKEEEDGESTKQNWKRRIEELRK